MGPWLHYDHDDSGSYYLGFAHSTCNRVAGALRGNALSRHDEPATRRTRDW